MLPPEFQTPPPRDPAAAGDVITNVRKGAYTLYLLAVGSVVAGLALDMKVRIRRPHWGWACVYFGLGLGVLFALIGVSFQLTVLRVKKFYRYGEATEGTIKSIKPGMMIVEFKNELGQTVTGQAAAPIKIEDKDDKEDDKIAILYLKDNRKRFIAYTPKFGTRVGGIKKIA